MADSRESFETYPYNPDVPTSFAPQDPAPAELRPRLTQPPVTSPPPAPSGMGRRTVLGIAGALGVAIVGGTVLSRQESPPDVYAETMVPDAYPDDEEPEPELTWAVLALPDGEELSVGVPVNWEVIDQGDYLVIHHEQGRLVARAPEWNRATRNDLAKEADYLRDGFDPGGEPTILDESTNLYTQLHQIAAGHLDGAAATEEVILILDGEQERALALWWATVDGSDPVPREARTMVSELREGFLQ